MKGLSHLRLRADTLLVGLVMLLIGITLGRYGSPELQSALLGEPAVVAEPAALPEAELSSEALDETAADDAIPQAGAPVRFVMQNVNNYFVAGEQQRGRYVVHPKPEEAREAVADVLAAAQPAIVGLIEIGGPAALADLRARLAKRGLDFPYYRVLVRSGEDRALALLSRYPIVRDESQAQYGLYGQKRRKMLRGILDITVKTDDDRLFRIIGAHLKSRVAKDGDAAADLRNQEARTLAMYLQTAQRQHPRVPLIVYGDWNDTPEDASVQIVEQGVSADAAMTRLAPRDTRGEEWTHFYKEKKEYSVLHGRMQPRKGCGIIDIPAAEKASDHRALWADLR